MPGTVLSMQSIYLVKKNYANPQEGDTKPPEGDNSMKFAYHQLNYMFLAFNIVLMRIISLAGSKNQKKPNKIINY